MDRSTPRRDPDRPPVSQATIVPDPLRGSPRTRGLPKYPGTTDPSLEDTGSYQVEYVLGTSGPTRPPSQDPRTPQGPATTRDVSLPVLTPYENPLLPSCETPQENSPHEGLCEDPRRPPTRATLKDLTGTPGGIRFQSVSVPRYRCPSSLPPPPRWQETPGKSRSVRRRRRHPTPGGPNCRPVTQGRSVTCRKGSRVTRQTARPVDNWRGRRPGGQGPVTGEDTPQGDRGTGPGYRGWTTDTPVDYPVPGPY